MTPTAKIVTLLSDHADELGLLVDNICPFMIDGENVDDQHPIIVVSEDLAGSHDFGNNGVLGTFRRLSIQLYYPKNYTGDMALIEKKIKVFLRNQDIRCYLDAGHMITPDNQNILNTLKFNFYEREGNVNG